MGCTCAKDDSDDANTNTDKANLLPEEKNNDDDAKVDVKSIINSRYSATARNFDATYSSTEKEKIQSIAKVFGYSVEELNEIGSGANMGLSCGNPVRNANLKKGEVVLDLGCGAGMDLFLAKKYIGDSDDGGLLLGIDFSKDMLAKATRNAERKKEKQNMDISNFRFMHSEIEDMKEVVDDDSVDCVISNCVINLVPDKEKAFKEIYRILKPNGGRICLSDIALKKPLPEILKNDITGVVNCVSGAILADEYEQYLYEAGFKNVKLVNKNVDLNVWKVNWHEMVNPSGDSSVVAGGCCQPAAINKDESGGCCAPTKDDGDDGADDGGDNNDKSQPETIEKKPETVSGGGGGCCAPSDGADNNLTEEEKEEINKILKETDMNDHIASYYVFGFK